MDFDRTLLAHFLRVPLSGLAYVAFALGGAFLGYLVMPFLYLWPGPLVLKRKRCQSVTGWAFRVFHWYLNIIGVMTYWPRDERVLERLRKTLAPSADASSARGMVVVANHPTLVDTTAILATFPHLLVVAKRSVGRFPLLAPLMKFNGYINNSADLGGSTVIAEELIARLRGGESVLLFPESTRSPDFGPRPFGRGPYEIALRAGVPIQPVVIRTGPGLLKGGLAWYQLPRRKTDYQLVALEPDSCTLSSPSPSGRQLAEKSYQQIVQALGGQATSPQPSHSNHENDPRRDIFSPR